MQYMQYIILDSIPFSRLTGIDNIFFLELADPLRRNEKQREARKLQMITPGSFLKDCGDSELSQTKCTKS